MLELNMAMLSYQRLSTTTTTTTTTYSKSLYAQHLNELWNVCLPSFSTSPGSQTDNLNHREPCLDPPYSPRQYPPLPSPACIRPCHRTGRYRYEAVRQQLATRLPGLQIPSSPRPGALPYCPWPQMSDSLCVNLSGFGFSATFQLRLLRASAMSPS